MTSFAYYGHGPANVEFGVCSGELGPENCSMVPIDDRVKELLEEMVLATRSGMGMDGLQGELPAYEPSQQYDSDTPLALPLGDPLAERLRSLYEQENISTNPSALREPQQVTAYFCTIHDRAGNKLMGVRRAAQFKGVLKRHMLQFIDETLQAVTDTVFKLDLDFDILIADDTLYIRRAGAFEQLASIDEQVLAHAAESATGLGDQLPLVDFGSLAQYVREHKRAARLIAALQRRTDLSVTSISNLRRECRRNGITFSLNNGKLSPNCGQELAFLQMLDRRRYTISLVSGRWEQYEAGSRRGVGVHERQPRRMAARVGTSARRTTNRN